MKSYYYNPVRYDHQLAVYSHHIEVTSEYLEIFMNGWDDPAKLAGNLVADGFY
jgi:hypothetical protein